MKRVVKMGLMGGGGGERERKDKIFKLLVISGVSWTLSNFET